MQYALLYYESPAEVARRDDPHGAPDYWAAWNVYMQLLTASGAMRGGNALQPPRTKTTVKKGATGRVVEDGPFADARDELGGFIIVEAEDLDAALRLAEAAPCAGAGYVEVRPVLPPPSASAAAAAEAA